METYRIALGCIRLHSWYHSIYLSHTALEGLGIYGKGLREIIRIEIRSPRTISIIARSCGQCHEGVKVFEVDNIKTKIIGAI